MPNLKGSIENLRRQLRALRFNYEVNFQGMVLGQPSAFVEFYRHLLCDYNAKLTSHLVERGFGMLGTTDNRFMEVFYRILRDVISFRPPVNLTQFFMTGFAERKIEMATTVALRIGSLIQRSLVSREKTGIQNGQHHHRNQLLNHPKPNSTSVFHSELPLVLPGVSYHRSVERSTDEPNVMSDNNKLYDGVMHSNERNSMTCGDLPNRNGFTHVKGVRSTENLSICQCPQESYNRCSNQSSVKVTKLSKIEPLCSGNYLRDEYDRMPNYALRSNYDQYKRAYHPLNSNPRVCVYSTLHNNCIRLPDGKYTTPTSKINTLSTMPPTKQSNSVNNTKQFSKDNYSALLTSSSQKYWNPNDHLLSNDGNVRATNHNESSFIHYESIRNIMNSLVQLTGKVDCMLDRMNKMEYKLTNVETGYMFNRSRTYGGPTVDSNRRNMDLGDFCGTDSVVERKILPNVTGEQNLLSMKTADSVSVTPVSSTLNTFSGTQFTSTTGTTTSASFLTTKTLNSCSVTCAERHVFGDANHGTSESFCSKPKYFTSTKLNIQENNPTSCKNAAEKIQSYTAKTAAQDSLDDQPIKIAPIIVSPLPDSHNFNENCRDISSRRETSDLVQLKYVDPLKTKNQFCDSRVTSTSLVDLDLKSEIKSPSVVRSNNSALAYYPCPNSTDYSVSNESSDPVDYKVTPSSSSSFSLSRKPDKTKSSATEKAQNSYRAQVERITNMLAETQNLLQERSSSKLNELAIENSDNIIDYNNGNNSNAVALKA